MKNEELCPCKSGKTFGECCGPIIAGAKKPASPEEVMRARYSAYVTESVDYLKSSSTKAGLAEFDEEASRAWCRVARWHGLEIIRAEGDTVEFRATYTANGEFCNHHEIAKFEMEDGQWKFADGEFVGETPIVREEPKTGRNDPCPCGSGKKFKKCCGK